MYDSFIAPDHEFCHWIFFRHHLQELIQRWPVFAVKLVSKTIKLFTQIKGVMYTLVRSCVYQIDDIGCMFYVKNIAVKNCFPFCQNLPSSAAFESPRV